MKSGGRKRRSVNRPHFDWISVSDVSLADILFIEQKWRLVVNEVAS